MTPSQTVGKGDNKQAEDKWCLCRDGEYGKMIACDDENCEFQWFHLDCVGLTKAPRGRWFCNDCRPLKRKHTKKVENQLNLSEKK